MNGGDDYYGRRVSELDRTDYFRHVGHTVNGTPIPEAHFHLLLDQIASTLELKSEDALLDVCCGNGLFTRQLASKVRSVVGIDWSNALIEIAQTDQAAGNIRYLQMDAHVIARLRAQYPEPFDKIVMYAALQHFTPGEFEDILPQMLDLASPNCAIMLGFVPDEALKWRFYDTAERQAEHERRRISGTDTFGHWWARPDLTRICMALGLTCDFGALPKGTHAAKYRFNAIIRRDAA